MYGFVKCVKVDRGYGFLRGDDGHDHFFHVSGLDGLVLEERIVDQRVEFEVGTDSRSGRPRATNIRPAR